MSDKKNELLKRGFFIVKTDSLLKVYGILSLYAPDDVALTKRQVWEYML